MPRLIHSCSLREDKFNVVVYIHTPRKFASSTKELISQLRVLLLGL